MARQSNTERLANIHEQALIEFDVIQSALKDEREQCLQDRRFYSIAGAQWEGNLGKQFENKPRFEVNKAHLAVIRIINEYRNNRITVDFVPKDGAKDDKLADACDGLYRADEQDSCAQEAYDNAFEEAVGGGFGAFRLRAEYEDEEDEENEYQRIRIEPIYDADSSVWFDLNAKRYDKSDARHCFVLTSMTMAAYKDEYDDDPTSWPKTVEQHKFDWYTADVVYVAEYYRIEKIKEIIRVFKTLDGTEEKYSEKEFESDEGLEARLLATGAKKIRQRKMMRKKVRKYVLSGGKVLEDCGYIAGSNIPIVPVYGKRWFIDNVERCMGHVRLCKDVQRLKNMQLSRLGEIAALSPIEKPILTPEQVAGHETMWAHDNITNYPYLLINPITNEAGQEVATGPVGYTKPPAIPPAMAALLQLTEQDMQDLLGNQQQGEELQPNMSGKAVELIQNRLDMQSYIYMSNLAKSIKRSGEVWLGMARDVLVEKGRKMKAVDRQGETSTIELMSPMPGEKGVENMYDFSDAKFDLYADVGPTSSSKRAATVRALTGMMQITADPETQQVLGAMAMMNMEGEGIQDVRDFFRQKLIRLGAIKPTDEEAQALMQEMQNTPPDPQAEYLNAAAAQAEAEAASARADTVYTIAKANSEEAKAAETNAKTIETLAGIDERERAQALESVKVAAEIAQKSQATATVQPEMGEETMRTDNEQ